MQVNDILTEMRKLRKSSEISAINYSKQIGISKNTLQACENLRMSPNLKTVISILDGLGYRLTIVKKD